MRATDFIRDILNLIDTDKPVAKEPIQEPVVIAIKTGNDRPDPHNDAETMARYRQIVDLIPDDAEKPFVNTVDEKYADIDSVLAGGTDLNKPKHPSDIRGEHISMYPNFQYDPKKE